MLGERGEHSDVDLLVILRNADSQKRRGNPIRRAIAERFITG
jgi:predicted nucleotidyltransferase